MAKSTPKRTGATRLAKTSKAGTTKKAAAPTKRTAARAVKAEDKAAVRKTSREDKAAAKDKDKAAAEVKGNSSDRAGRAERRTEKRASGGGEAPPPKKARAERDPDYVARMSPSFLKSVGLAGVSRSVLVRVDALLEPRHSIMLTNVWGNHFSHHFVTTYEGAVEVSDGTQHRVVVELWNAHSTLQLQLGSVVLVRAAKVHKVSGDNVPRAAHRRDAQLRVEAGGGPGGGWGGG